MKSIIKIPKGNSFITLEGNTRIGTDLSWLPEEAKGNHPPYLLSKLVCKLNARYFHDPI